MVLLTRNSSFESWVAAAASVALLPRKTFGGPTDPLCRRALTTQRTAKARQPAICAGWRDLGEIGASVV